MRSSRCSSKCMSASSSQGPLPPPLIVCTSRGGAATAAAASAAQGRELVAGAVAWTTLSARGHACQLRAGGACSARRGVVWMRPLRYPLLFGGKTRAHVDAHAVPQPTVAALGACKRADAATAVAVCLRVNECVSACMTVVATEWADKSAEQAERWVSSHRCQEGAEATAADQTARAEQTAPASQVHSSSPSLCPFLAATQPKTKQDRDCATAGKKKQKHRAAALRRGGTQRELNGVRRRAASMTGWAAWLGRAQAPCTEPEP
jgi:hypothetical protein